MHAIAMREDEFNANRTEQDESIFDLANCFSLFTRIIELLHSLYFEEFVESLLFMFMLFALLCTKLCIFLSYKMYCLVDCE